MINQMNAENYKINFNQDFTSISVLDKNGYRLFTLSSVDKVEEIYCKENDDDIRIVERLFSSSLIVLVTNSKPNCLKMLHFKKKQDICNCVYPSDILTLRMNRTRLIVCLAESIHIHDIRNMKVLHSINDINPNVLGLCSLSLNSHLAYPISSKSGELQIYNADNLSFGLSIKAHETPLSALNFSPNGVLIATSSERGTVIRVFCVKNGQKVHEFRRGVKRCASITSLVFSTNADFISCSSNTGTIHIFKIDSKAVDAAERRSIIDQNNSETVIANTSSSEEDLNQQTTTKATLPKSSSSTKLSELPLPLPTSPDLDNNVSNKNSNDDNSNNNQNSSSSSSSWSGYFTSYFPSQVYDVFCQDRAFATAQLNQPGLKHWCALGRLQKETKLLVACEDGFLYIYDFNDARGGLCKLIRAHDLRNPLEGIIELNMNDNNENNNLRSPKKSKILKTDNSQISQDTSYAAVLKGNQRNEMTESDKFRNLNDAIIDTPTKSIFDDCQFPPVASSVRQ